MRKAALPYILSLSLSTLPLSAAAPELAWSSFLGGGGHDVAEDVLIDGDTVYVVGTTESEDFPGAVYPPGLRHPFVAAIGLDGTFRFASILDVGLFAEGRSVAMGPQALYLGGQANLGFGSDEAGGFVARLGRADGELLDWQLLGNAAVNDLEVIDDGEIWATTGGTYWGDWAVWKLDLSSPPVRVLFSQEDDIQALELGPANDLYLTGGDVDSRFFFQGSYVERRTRSGDVVFRTLLPGSGPVYFSADLAVTPDGKVYVAGLINQASGDDLFVAKLDASGRVERVRVLGGSAEDAARTVALGPSGEVFVAGTTRSEDFPVRDPIVSECDTPGGACAFVMRLDSNLDLVWSTYLAASAGGPWGRSFGIGAGADGPVVVGHTDGSLFPLVTPFDAEAAGGEGFVARIRDGNRPPDCSAATASPSVIWPPNGKMVPVTVQGLEDGLQVEVTAIHQDEPLTGGGPDASGLGTSTAAVRASRSGEGDGRVYRLTFRAAGPEGSSCTGEVTVCVPHDRRASACGDGGAAVDSTLPAPRSSALLWSTWLGGSADELKLADVEIDASGFAWIAGTTASEDYTGILDHPEEDETFILDAFASRLDPAGRLDHSRVLGQPFEDEHIEGLAIGPGGAVSLAGFMDNFGDHDVIATQIRADGAGGGFAHYIGENNHEFSTAVTTDRTGNVYIVGTGSRFFPGFGGDFEGGAYVLKLGPNHDFVDLFPLGEAAGRPSAVAVDPAGNIHVAGDAEEVRVAKLDPAGNLLWSTRLGGSQTEAATSLKVDPAGRAWVAGWTDSPDFPIRGGRPYAGGRDAFLVRLTPGGGIDLSTLLGGAGDDEAQDLALDALGRPYLAGLTGSADFPLAGAPRGGTDAFAASFGLTGPASLTLSFALRLGGGSSDEAWGVAVDPVGTILWIAGLTRSADFPVLNPWQPALAGGADAFVAKIALAPGSDIATSPK